MIVKLKTGLQTKNHLGISAQDLEEMTLDKEYNYLRSPEFKIEPDKRGELFALKAIALNVHKDYMAIIVPNPKLAEYGIVWGNTMIAGAAEPVIYFKAHKPGAIELEYLYDIRLIS